MRHTAAGMGLTATVEFSAVAIGCARFASDTVAHDDPPFITLVDEFSELTAVRLDEALEGSFKADVYSHAYVLTGVLKRETMSQAARRVRRLKAALAFEKDRVTFLLQKLSAKTTKVYLVPVGATPPTCDEKTICRRID